MVKKEREGEHFRGFVVYGEKEKKKNVGPITHIENNSTTLECHGKLDCHSSGQNSRVNPQTHSGLLHNATATPGKPH